MASISGRLYLRTILPIGLLYTVSLGCANLAYLYLSVPFIQMLKALAPVVTLLMSWAASLADPRVSTLGTVLVIALGVLLAGVGEVRFVWAGFVVHSNYAPSSLLLPPFRCGACGLCPVLLTRIE